MHVVWIFEMIEIVASIDSCMNILQRKTHQNGYEHNGGISIHYTGK